MLLAASAALTVAAGTLLAVGVARQEPAPPQAAPAAQSSSGVPPSPVGAPPAQGKAPAPGHEHDHGGAAGGTSTGQILPRSEPQRISVPALGIRSSLEGLGLDAQRAMQTPRDPNRAGWFTPGPTPGQKGPAVIAGHVTWNDKPAVFLKLGALKKGQRIEIARADGRTAVFTVERTARYPKKEFPTLEVYKNLDRAGLRLITCGGDYSTATRRYADNVVVYASLSSVA